MYVLREYETDYYNNFQGYKDDTYFDKETLIASLTKLTDTCKEKCIHMDKSYICIVDLFEPEKSIKVSVLEFLEDDSLRTARKTLKEMRKLYGYSAE